MFPLKSYKWICTIWHQIHKTLQTHILKTENKHMNALNTSISPVVGYLWGERKSRNRSLRRLQLYLMSYFFLNKSQWERYNANMTFLYLLTKGNILSFSTVFEIFSTFLKVLCPRANEHLFESAILACIAQNSPQSTEFGEVTCGYISDCLAQFNFKTYAI